MQNNTYIDQKKIVGKRWRFSTETGYVGTDCFEFLSDGRIFGVQGVNECFWEIKEDHISVMNGDREPTVRLREVIDPDGKLSLRGCHIPDPSITLILEERGLIHTSYGSMKYALENEVRHLGWSIGDHSYGMPTFVEKGMSRLVIGKYCSIAEGCKISFGDHRTDFATTYPFASLRHFWKAPEGVNDHRSKGDVSIGNDVWIGSDVFIGSGVTIGHGAVIGGRAVVTKSVPPYAIAVGSPAKVVKYRFDEDTIAQLLELAWWDLDDYVVESLLPVMLSIDIHRFIKALRNVRSIL